MRAALTQLAVLAPDWLRQGTPPDWYERDKRRSEEERLPKGKEARAAYARTVGEEGFRLLDALEAADSPPELRQLEIIRTLRVTWQRHYERTTGQDSEVGPASQPRIRWKENRELPRAAAGMESPYDPDARYRSKRETQWTGYMVHDTETCDLDQVYLITHVKTTPATVHEAQGTAPLQAALSHRGLLPHEHIVDAAYIDAELLVSSRQEHGITLVGPTRPNPSWQTKVEGAYTKEHFTVDWERRQVRCPQGKLSSSWTEQRELRENPPISVHFRKQDCAVCPTRALCTRSQQPRQFNLLPQPQFTALQAARAEHTSEAGRKLYARRAGIEGTLSQGVRAFGLRRTRYRGLPETHLQPVVTAVAVNVGRIIAWCDKIPRAKTRTSRFAALAA